ncbi:hypothetical protein GCM10010381_03850 [Streptomyces xantholiticus]|nr:hypothetical protein GCM10010381_03850 [Streptomyces xantholiticus]
MGRGIAQWAVTAGLADEPLFSGDGNRPVHVPGDPPDAQELRGVLGEAGVVPGTGTGPADNSLVLVPVGGTTVAAAVAQAGRPAARTPGVDPLSLPTRAGSCP